MSIVKRVALLLLLALLLGLAWLVWRFQARPSLEPYLPLALPAAAAPQPAGALRVTFLGVSSLLLSDGETALLTDGFFTRPAGREVLLGKIAPDRALIARSLQRAGIAKLDAVIALHSHYDHAMDSPEVAQRTGAMLLGSASTAQIARGWGLAPERMQLLQDGQVLRYGRFEITVLRSRHFPHPLAMGEITEPLRPPVRADAYREGGSYQLLVKHEGRSLLIAGSAGFVPERLRGLQAEVVYLGIGGLGGKDEAYRADYWRETVQLTQAKRVIPIHWDDFTLPLDQPLRPGRLLFDDMEASMAFLQRRAAAEGVELRLALPWQAVDPFAGLRR